MCRSRGLPEPAKVISTWDEHCRNWAATAKPAWRCPAAPPPANNTWLVAIWELRVESWELRVESWEWPCWIIILKKISDRMNRIFKILFHWDEIHDFPASFFSLRLSVLARSFFISVAKSQSRKVAKMLLSSWISVRRIVIWLRPPLASSSLCWFRGCS